jgi:hypothetical protein
VNDFDEPEEPTVNTLNQTEIELSINGTCPNCDERISFYGSGILSEIKEENL